MRPQPLAACLALAVLLPLGAAAQPAPAPPRLPRPGSRCGACACRAHRQLRQWARPGLHVPGLPWHYRLQERLSQLPGAEDRRPDPAVPGPGPDRVPPGQAPASDDAGAVDEFQRTGDRRSLFTCPPSSKARPCRKPRIRCVTPSPCPLPCCWRPVHSRRWKTARPPPPTRACQRRARFSSSAGLPTGREAAGEARAKVKGKATNQSCIDCHGADGNAPIDPTYPKLGGSTVTTWHTRCRPTAPVIASMR